MFDPLRRLKFLPWRSLALLTLATFVIVAVIEVILGLGYTQVSVVRAVLNPLFGAPWVVLTLLAAGFGIGVLAVFLLETRWPQVSINAGVLWALVLCLILGAVIRSLMPLPVILVSPSQTQFMGFLVGIFWRGRPYWH
uniref:peptide chain release factor 1 n=1 Tax=Trichocoleus desertorum TaxID=1481672 RepID=UPI0025B4A1F1|nr:peptide chain release factor 1 [Trichocoleus desertorum]